MMLNTIDPNEVAKFNALAETWWDASGPFKTLHHINPVRIQFVQSCVAVTDLTVLDVGCGGGILAEALAQLGANVLGIDADESSIATATHHALNQNLKLAYQATPIEQLEASDFDVITCMEMIEHVSCPQSVIQQCAQKLRPGGWLFLSTINRTMNAYLSAIVMAEYVLQLLPRQTHDYARFIRPSELAAMIRQAGLEMVKMEGMGYSPFTQQAYLQNSVQVNYLMACRKL